MNLMLHDGGFRNIQYFAKIIGFGQFIQDSSADTNWMWAAGHGFRATNTIARWTSILYCHWAKVLRPRLLNHGLFNHELLGHIGIRSYGNWYKISFQGHYFCLYKHDSQTALYNLAILILLCHRSLHEYVKVYTICKLHFPALTKSMVKNNSLSLYPNYSSAPTSFVTTLARIALCARTFRQLIFLKRGSEKIYIAISADHIRWYR